MRDLVSCHYHGQVKISQGANARCLAASVSNRWLKSPDSTGKEVMEKGARLPWSSPKLPGVSSITDALVKPMNLDWPFMDARLLPSSGSQSPLQLGGVPADELG